MAQSYQERIEAYNKHWDNLNNSLGNNKQIIKSNYQEAYQTYNKMRQAFMSRMQKTKLDGVSGKEIQKFKNNINEWYHTIDPPLAKEKINAGFAELVDVVKNNQNIQLMIDHIIKDDIKAALNIKAAQVKPKKDSSSEKIKLRSDSKKVKYKTNWQNITEDYLDEEINKLIEKHPIYANEFNKILGSSPLLGQNQGYDPTDILNKLIKPIIRNKVKETLGICQKKIQQKSAKGYFYEAAVAKMISIFYKDNFDPKVAVVHMGKDNKSADITIDFAEALDQTDKENQTRYGIQVKNYDFKDFDNLNNSYSSIYFQRISNRAELLKEFQSSYSKYFKDKIVNNKTKTVLQDETKKDRENYSMLQAQAMFFLSEQKRLYNILGEENVGYVEQSKFVWTSQLLKTWITKNRWLCFQSGLHREFTAEIGLL